MSTTAPTQSPVDHDSRRRACRRSRAGPRHEAARPAPTGRPAGRRARPGRPGRRAHARVGGRRPEPAVRDERLHDQPEAERRPEVRERLGMMNAEYESAGTDTGARGGDQRRRTADELGRARRSGRSPPSSRARRGTSPRTRMACGEPPDGREEVRVERVERVRLRRGSPGAPWRRSPREVGVLDLVREEPRRRGAQAW